MLELLSRNNIAPGVGGGRVCSLWTRWLHGATLKIELKMSQRFCPGLSVVLEVIDVLLPVITDMIILSFESRKLVSPGRRH